MVTTHSPLVVNGTDFESILSVRMEGGRSKVSRIDMTKPAFQGWAGLDLQAAVLRREQRGALFLAKGAILVEGPYDRLVVEAICRTCDVNLARRDVAIIEMGGKGGISTYYPLLREIKKPFLVLLDFDAFADSRGKTLRQGSVVRLLDRDGLLPAETWVGNHLQQVHAMNVAQRCSEVRDLSRPMISSGFGLATHGHHDIKDYLWSRWQGLTTDEKLRVYMATGGRAPSFDEQRAD